MTGYTVHTGTSVKFSSGWDRVFNSGSKSESKPAKKATTSKTVKKKAAKKATASKVAAPTKKKAVSQATKRGK